MTEQIFPRIKSYMKSQSLIVNDSWLRECVEYFCSQNTQINENNIQQFVKEQFLLSDLREINSNGCLPPNLSQQQKTSLNSKYTLQLLKLYDISVPKFKQLEKIRNVSNVNIEATNETNTQPWEPTGKRMLQLFLTDGVQEILAIEYKPIRILNDSLLPGLKIMIIGPVTCRRGVIFLEEANISIKGGEVDDLLIPNALENILANALKLPTNDDPYNDQKKKEATTVPNDFIDDLNIDFEEIEHSVALAQKREGNLKTQQLSNKNSSTNGNNLQIPKKQIVQEICEFPEDDDLLFEDFEMDEGFSSHCPSDNKPSTSNFQQSKPSNSNFLEFPDDDFDLNDVDFDSGITWSESDKNDVKNSEIKKESNVSRQEIPRNVHRDDSRNDPREDIPKNVPRVDVQEVVTGSKRSSAQLSPIQSSTKIQCPLNVTKSGNSNRKITDFLGNKTKKEESPPKVCDFICEISTLSLGNSPICRSVRAKVTAVGPLTRKNNLWILNGTIADQTGKLDIDFSSQLMENILGLSVSEFSQLKKKGKTDPELQDKLKQQLVDGQNKMQQTDYLMELEMKKSTKPLILSFSQLNESQKNAHSKRLKFLQSKNRA